MNFDRRLDQNQKDAMTTDTDCRAFDAATDLLMLSVNVGADLLPPVPDRKLTRAEVKAINARFNELVRAYLERRNPGMRFPWHDNPRWPAK
ncbi:MULTISPECIES: hypothetical protein [unclassified Variovorax]|uniref:hypothetical protein n=1 Tax=unclassified Variovorax TaxID=663243 RepID=UPI00076C309B|nr:MULTISPECIES: hypothetical protein [unclassified Variovorax]KWT73970.1 hypothetical protein APY03_5821 [Variovorax sp. WDL1]PNG52307.1 hypothetical protein CHC07_04679 [Variovorax sp. B4]PNG54847.1 hypothetical protein CHC06_03645 [Variovorax sp. B2]VTV15858.1 hypothetical protein WDL1CHR_06219 [Variovorax sp. WDL1]